MKRTFLTGTAAIAILAVAGVGMAAAQAPERAPGQQMQRGGDTGGDRGASGAAPGRQMQDQGSKPGQPGASGTAPGRSAGEGSRRDGTPGTKQGQRDDTPATRQGQRSEDAGRDGRRDGDAKPKQTQRDGAADRDASPARQGQKEGQKEGQKDGRRDADSRRGDRAGETTGTAGSVSINTEQRTRIRERRSVLSRGRVTNVNFTVSVGTVVPRTVEIYALPPTIVEIVPEYRGYHYIMVEDEILIIDPETLRIVAVIDA